MHNFTQVQIQVASSVFSLTAQREGRGRGEWYKYQSMQIHKCTNTQMLIHKYKRHKHTNTNVQMHKYTTSCRWGSRWIHQSLEMWYIQREEEEKDQHDTKTFTDTLTYKRIQTSTNLQIQNLVSDEIQVSSSLLEAGERKRKTREDSGTWHQSHQYFAGKSWLAK